jgi:hypothetical protein
VAVGGADSLQGAAARARHTQREGEQETREQEQEASLARSSDRVRLVCAFAVFVGLVCLGQAVAEGSAKCRSELKTQTQKK